MEITDEEIKQLEVLLPDAIKFAHQLHMDQQQQKLQLEMEKEMAVYEEKMRSWKRSKEHQMEIEFGDKPEYGFVKDAGEIRRSRLRPYSTGRANISKI